MRRFCMPLVLLCSFMLISYLTANAQAPGAGAGMVLAVDDGTGNVVLAISEESAIAAFEADFGDGTVFTDVTIDHDASIAGAPYYLVATGSVGGNSRTTAVELVNIGGQLRAAADKHTCTGAPCEGCAFDNDKNGKIIGCKCDASPVVGRCNHTISTGTLQFGAETEINPR